VVVAAEEAVAVLEVVAVVAGIGSGRSFHRSRHRPLTLRGFPKRSKFLHASRDS